MNTSLLLTKRLNNTPDAERYISDFIRAGGDHVYINWAEGFPYTDGHTEADMETRTDSIIRQCQAANVTWGFVCMNLSKALYKDTQGRVSPVTIPTRKMSGVGFSHPYNLRFDLVQGNATYRKWLDLDFGEGNDYRRIALRFRNVGPGVCDFFWALPDGSQVYKLEHCGGSAFHTVYLHTLDSSKWRPMWRLNGNVNTSVILNVVNEVYFPDEFKGGIDGWYDCAGIEREPINTTGSRITNAVNCRTADFSNRIRMEDVYLSMDRLQAKWGHLAGRGPDFFSSDEFNNCGWRKVAQTEPDCVNVGQYVTAEILRAARHNHALTGFKPRFWWDLGLGVRSRGNSPLNGGFEDGVNLIPRKAPCVPAFWAENPPAVSWGVEFDISGEREKAVCIYLDKTDPHLVRQAIEATAPNHQPVECILQNTENDYRFDLMKDAIEAMK